MLNHPSAPVLCVVAAALFISTAAQAQPLRDASDANAPVPPTLYRSAFADYRANTTQAPGSWRQANDTAGRIGGWRAYARQASEAAVPVTAPVPPAAPASTAAPRATPTPAATGHGVHHKP